MSLKPIQDAVVAETKKEELITPEGMGSKSYHRTSNCSQNP